MNFKYRLAYFSFGLMIGVMFLMFFLGNKKTEFCYLPNCRVLKNIRSKNMSITDEAQQKLDEKWVTIDDIRNVMQNGDVDFSRSKDKFKGGTIYVVEGKTVNGEAIEVTMVNYDNKSLLKDVKKQ